MISSNVIEDDTAEGNLLSHCEMSKVQGVCCLIKCCIKRFIISHAGTLRELVCVYVLVCVRCRDSLNICDMTQMLGESDAYAVKCILFFHPLFIFYHTCQQGSAACRNYPCVSVYESVFCVRVCARMFVTPSDVMRCIRRC